MLADEFLSGINPDKGFLIGSKRCGHRSEESITLFAKFKKCLTSKIKNLTIFEEHTYPLSETDVAYDMATDTLTLCSKFQRPNETQASFVQNRKELLECFKKVEISEQDTLYFNGVKEKL